MTIHRRHPVRADELVGWGSHLVTGVEATREREMAPPRNCERCGRPMSLYHQGYERICRPCHHTLQGWS